MAHKGTSTFIVQRFTAALLIPLAIWFLISVVSHLGADYETARAWAGKWWNAALIAAFLIIGAMHMRIGLAEIIADYIQSGVKDILSLINWLVALAIIAGALWSLYNISFAG